MILIAGILAAIAVPTFSGQNAQAEDGDTQANIRNAVSLVESCFSEHQDYGECTTEKGLSGGSSVTVTGSGSSETGHFLVTAKSKSGTSFSYSDRAATGVERSCDKPGVGGCDGSSGGSSGTW